MIRHSTAFHEEYSGHALSPEQAVASEPFPRAGAITPCSLAEADAVLLPLGMGLWEFDPATGKVTLGTVARRLAPVSGCAAEVDVADVLDWVLPQGRDAVRLALTRTWRAGLPVDLDVPVGRGRGPVRWVQLRAFRIDDGPNGGRLRGTVHDVTVRQEQEEILNEQAERHRLLVEHTDELVSEMTVDGRMLYANPSHRRVLGYAPEELIGTVAFDLVHPEDLPRIVAHFEGDRATDVYRFRHKDGSWRWLESTGTRFRMLKGEERGVIISRDVTARRRAEEEKSGLESRLRHAQKMEAVGTLAAGIAHDFNNILGVIVAHTELARMDLPASHPVQHGLSHIQQAGGRAKNLVDQLLVFSRQQQEERRVLSLNDPVAEAVEEFRGSATTGVEIVFRPDPSGTTAFVDPAHIRQLTWNLCANAILALPGGVGRIEVAVDRVDEARESIEGLARGPHVRLTVRDNGAGMDEATLKRVFDPFFTTRPPGQGAGLGLAVAHGVTKSHGGVIRAVSEPGKGSCFEVFLPRYPERG